MEFTIQQAELATALKALNASCSKRFTLPILRYVLIEAKDGEARLTTTNLTTRTTFTTTDTVDVIEEGVYLVEYEQLYEMVKVFPKRASVRIRQQGTDVELICSGSKKVRSMDPEEYPTIPDMRAPGETYTDTRREYEPNSIGGKQLVTNHYTYEILATHTQSICLSSDVLAYMLKQVSFAAADNDVRPVLQNIHMQLANDQLAMKAGDGFRAAKQVVEVPCSGSWTYPVLIDAQSYGQIGKSLPKKATAIVEALMTLERLDTKNGEAVADAPTFQRTRVVRFITESTTVYYLRPADDPYKGYEHRLPTEEGVRVRCNTEELRNGYKAVSPVAKDAGETTRLRLKQGLICIEASSLAQPEPTVHEIPATVAGELAKPVWLNGQYMLDFLKVVRTPEVLIEISEPNQPLIVRPVHAAGSGEEAEYVLMPLHDK